MSLRFLPPRLVLCRIAVLASISRPYVATSAYLQRKKYPVGCWLCINLLISRPRTPLISLSLLPLAILVLFLVATSYSPRRFGSLAIASLVYLFQLVQSAITHLPTIFRSFYTYFVIDGNYPFVLSLAERLGVTEWTTEKSMRLKGGL